MFIYAVVAASCLPFLVQDVTSAAALVTLHAVFFVFSVANVAYVLYLRIKYYEGYAFVERLRKSWLAVYNDSITETVAYMYLLILSAVVLHERGILTWSNLIK